MSDTPREQTMKTLDEITLEVAQGYTTGKNAYYFNDAIVVDFARRLIERIGQQEPVAWQYRIYYTEPDDSGWGMWHECNQAQAQELHGRTGYEVRELYAASVVREDMVEVPTSLLDRWIAYATSPAGMTKEIVQDEVAFSRFIDGIDKVEAELIADTESILAAKEQP